MSGFCKFFTPQAIFLVTDSHYGIIRHHQVIHGMKKSAEQWVIVNGRVFRLERVVDDVYTALLLQRTLRSTCEIHLERIEDGRWAVYWRSKQAIECTPQLKGTPTH